MMQLMASAVTYPYRVIQDQMQRNQMTKGYPITTEPFVPDIMKHKVEWKVIECKDGFRFVGFATAPEGSELVETESLEMIRTILWTAFQLNCPEHAKQFETTLPRNTIAISFSEGNFDVGTSCQEFVPCDELKTSEETFLTYQKLSENVQVTYYNHNGNQFLAGICYYPVPNGNVMYLKNDSALIYLAKMSSEEYPLCDRSKSYRNVNYNTYGRYCKNYAGKRVVVDCSGKFGAIRHLEYNHYTELFESVKCMECLEDAATYKWVEPKKEVPSPVTKQPFVPDTLKHAVDWKTWVSKEGRPVIGFTQAAEGSEFSTPECLEMFKTRIAKWLENFPEFSKKIETPLPRNTIAVSFSKSNFQVGKSCQDFFPYDKSEVPDAFYTYQMISKNLQATYYNENGVEFLAGICWYLPSNGKTISLNRDLKLINLAIFSAEPFPLQDRNKSFNKINYNIYGRYCKTARRRVAVDCRREYGTIRHLEVNSTFNKYEYTPCEECLEDYFTYKWVEEPKKREPEFLDTSSTASSDSLLVDYDQIENTENFTESDKEFDADVIY